MTLYHLCRMLLATLLLLSNYRLAIAFTEDGFSEGISLEETRAVAERQGHRLGERLERGAYDLYVSGFAETSYEFEFCHNRLVGYSKPFRNLVELAPVIDHETRVDGPAKILMFSSDNNSGAGLVGGQGSASVSLRWQRDDDLITIIISQDIHPLSAFGGQLQKDDLRSSVKTFLEQRWRSTAACIVTP